MSGRYEERPSVVAVAESITRLTNYMLVTAAVAWLLPLILTSPSFFRAFLYAACVAVWGYARWHSSTDTLPLTRAMRSGEEGWHATGWSNPAWMWRTIAVIVTVLVWLICIVPGAQGWKVVNLAFVVNAAALAVIWSAGSVAHRMVWCSLSQDHLPAERTAERANLITTWALAIAAVLWLLPLYPTPTGPSWFMVIACVVIAWVFGYAGGENYRAGGGIVQMHLGTKGAEALDLPAKLSISFYRSVRAAYAAIGLSVVVFLLYYDSTPPHWKTVVFSFACTVIAMAAVFGAKLAAAQVVFAGRALAASMAAARARDGSAAESAG